ncbi:MAG: RnfABCDGE type electron transport complex subunit D [Pseudomonadota bacterium]
MSRSYLTVSMSPHIRSGRTIRGMTMAVLWALLPALIFGLFQFGLWALVLVLVGVGGAVGTEVALCALTGRKPTILDYHAVLVGLTLVMMVPAGAPWWLVLVGSIMAVLVGKLPFGPFGSAPINPALVGLLIVALSWPGQVSSYVHPRTAQLRSDPVAVALSAENAAPAEAPQDAVTIDPSDALDYSPAGLFLGDQAGGIGTVSPLLLLLGGLFLIGRRVARWQGPVGFLLGMAVAGGIAHGIDPGLFPCASFQLLTGAAFFGAFFLCTEWTSTPVTPWGLFLWGLSAGALALLFRVTGGLPFGRVAFAIGFMSLLTPLFDRLAPTPFGKGVRHA